MMPTTPSSKRANKVEALADARKFRDQYPARDWYVVESRGAFYVDSDQTLGMVRSFESIVWHNGKVMQS
jgi:hypothetical protein